MADTPTPDALFARADDDICALASVAVPVPLAAGAADAEAGPAVRADLVAHQTAALHRFMLRLSGRANDILDWARARDGSAGPSATQADLAAARVAATGGRLLESCRHGLTALARLRPAAADATVFETVTWPAGTLPDADVRQRPEAAEAQAAEAQAAEDKVAEDADGRLSPRAQEIRAKAALEARILADEARAGDLCEIAAGDRPGWGLAYLSRLFGHQLAAGHGMAMRLLGGADRALDRATTEGEEPAESLLLANAAARLTDRVRRGTLALDKLGRGPKGGPKGGTGCDVGPVRIGDMPEAAPEAANTNDAAAPSAAPEAPAAKLYAQLGQSRGRLANGNPSGDYMAAPRCGACTRAGTACRQPAMKNGRCRFHGGKSTGPRTAHGLARARTARLTHGGYSAEVIDLQKAAVAAARELRTLVGVGLRPAHAAVPAGHGVDPLKPRKAA